MDRIALSRPRNQSVSFFASLFVALICVLPSQAGTLSVTGGSGFSNPLTVGPNPGPIAQFSAVDTNIPNGITPTWSASITGAQLGWSITPNGNGSAVVQVGGSNLTPGTYSVTLTVTATYSVPYAGQQTDSGGISFTLKVVGVTMPQSPITIAVNGSQTCNATVIPTGASGISYQSANTSVATVTGSGSSFTVTGVSSGTTQINAMFGSTTLGSVTVIVVSATFSPSSLALYVGQTQGVTVTVNPSSAPITLTFQSANPAIASVQGGTGQCSVTGNAVGTTQISAIWNGTTLATLSVTVSALSVTFSPSPIYVGVGGNISVTATVTPPSGAGLVTYSTSNSSIATASGSGTTVTVQGVAAGTTQLTASTSSGIVGSATINVVSVSFNPSTTYVGVGQSASVTATVTPSSAASQVSFSTSAPGTATVSGSAPTLSVTGVAVGTTSLQAQLGSATIGTGTINVVGVQFSPNPVQLVVGQSLNVTATVTPSVPSGQVTYQSANSAIATVSGAGPTLNVTGVAAGSTQVQALLNGSVISSVPVNVSTLTVSFSPNPINVAVGGNAMVQATVTPSWASSLVTYSTANTSIATASGTGTAVGVQGIAAGTTQLNANGPSGNVGSATINVISVTFSPSSVFVGVGQSVNVTATVTPSSAASQVTFSTMDSTIATVSGSAPTLSVTGVAAGTTSLQAQLGSTTIATATINVVGVQFSPNPVQLLVGQTVNVTATVTPSSASSQVTYQSADPTIATVSGTGSTLSVTGVAAGSTQVQALLNGSVIGSVPVNVSTLSVTFNPNPIYVPLGGSTTVQVTVTPSWASSLVSYSTANMSIASATGSGSSVTVQGMSAGSTQLNANGPSGVAGSATVDVVTVTFDPNPSFVGVGQSETVTANVSFTGAASQVTFSTADSTIATVSGSAPSLTVTGVAAGTTSLIAQMNGTTIGTGTINVVSVQFSPNPAQVRVKHSSAVNAMVTPLSASGQITYQIVDTSLATVTGTGPKLKLEGIKAGTTQLEAILNGTVIGSVEVQVLVVVGFKSAHYCFKEIQHKAKFTVILTGPSTATVTVQCATADDPSAGGNAAVAGVDYVATQGTITFPPGTTEQVFEVHLLDKRNGNGYRQFDLNLSDPVNALLSD